MPSITEKINQLEAPEGELGKHYKTKINMEAEIEKLLRPTPTYLLMRYALQCRLTAKQTYGEFKGVLTLHDNCITKDEDKDTYHFIIYHEDDFGYISNDIAHFYFHYDTDKNTIYVTSGLVATQTISTEDVVNVLKATIAQRRIKEKLNVRTIIN